MAKSNETEGVVNVLNAAFRQTRPPTKPNVVRLPGRALLTVAELALIQWGVPGATACFEYVAERWGNYVRRRTSWQGTANRPCDAVPASATTARDHERSSRPC